jgi:hypothetical protein
MSSASDTSLSRNERPSGRSQLGGEDSNPQLQGQNLPCCRLHHPRTGGVIVTGAGNGLAEDVVKLDQHKCRTASGLTVESGTLSAGLSSQSLDRSI